MCSVEGISGLQAGEEAKQVTAAEEVNASSQAGHPIR